MCACRTYGLSMEAGAIGRGAWEGDVVSAVKGSGDAGHARWTFRLRVSSTAGCALLAEWDRCRWIWNESVAKSKQTDLWNKNRPEDTDKATCGPARLDTMLTEARAKTLWLREGSSVPQQQIIRDFGKSRAKAQKDIRERLPQHRRAGMPKYKKKREADPSLNYTRRGFRLKDGRLHLAGNIGPDGRVVAGSSRRAVLGARVPRQPRALVRLVRRARRSPATVRDRPGDRDRLGG